MGNDRMLTVANKALGHLQRRRAIAKKYRERKKAREQRNNENSDTNMTKKKQRTYTSAARPAPPPHLAAYFMQRIPICPSSDLKLLEAFACDNSAVAEACIAAIDSAAALYEHVLKTTANDYPDRNEAVARVALQICLNYAYG